MKLAIMQPYLFPYIGYFQLIYAADKFVVFDDVYYINKGWINRNNILINGVSNLFTVPLKEASQNKLINEVYICEDLKWRSKLLKTIELSYKKAPFFKEVFPLIEKAFNLNIEKIAAFNTEIIKTICSFLEIRTEIVSSSSIYNNSTKKGQDRILDICLKESASYYINPIGGVELYSNAIFQENKIELRFIKSKSITYKQFENKFIPGLSIIDVLMFNKQSDIINMRGQYELIN